MRRPTVKVSAGSETHAERGRAYLSLAFQSVAVSNDLSWTSFPLVLGLDFVSEEA